MVAGEEVEKAQKEYDIAEANYQNTVKYGCANPTVMTGLVSLS